MKVTGVTNLSTGAENGREMLNLKNTFLESGIFHWYWDFFHLYTTLVTTYISDFVLVYDFASKTADYTQKDPYCFALLRCLLISPSDLRVQSLLLSLFPKQAYYAFTLLRFLSLFNWLFCILLCFIYAIISYVYMTHCFIYDILYFIHIMIMHLLSCGSFHYFNSSSVLKYLFLDWGWTNNAKIWF